jgi:chromosome segregation ATPase
MAQPRTDTATLIKSCRLIWLHLQSDDEVASTALREIADRLEEQEATIEALRAELVELTAKAMSEEDVIRHLRAELCNASAVAMEHRNSISQLRADLAERTSAAGNYVTKFRELNKKIIDLESCLRRERCRDE